MSLTGTCKSFGNCTGFGFITADDGPDVFVHITDCTDGMMPAKGDVLFYELGPSTKKPGQTAAFKVTGGSAKQTAAERMSGGKGKGDGDMTSRMPMMMKMMQKLQNLESKMGIMETNVADILKKNAQEKDSHAKLEGAVSAIEKKLEEKLENAMADLQKMMSQQFDARFKKIEQSFDMLHERTIKCGYNSRALQQLEDKVAKQQKEMSEQEAAVENQNEERAERKEADFDKLEKYFDDNIERIFEARFKDMEQMAMAPTRSVPLKKKKKK
jgi:cold shock CspA family protein